MAFTEVTRDTFEETTKMSIDLQAHAFEMRPSMLISRGQDAESSLAEKRMRLDDSSTFSCSSSSHLALINMGYIHLFKTAIQTDYVISINLGAEVVIVGASFVEETHLIVATTTGEQIILSIVDKTIAVVSRREPEEEESWERATVCTLYYKETNTVAVLVSSNVGSISYFTLSYWSDLASDAEKLSHAFVGASRTTVPADMRQTCSPAGGLCMGVTGEGTLAEIIPTSEGVSFAPLYSDVFEDCVQCRSLCGGSVLVFLDSHSSLHVVDGYSKLALATLPIPVGSDERVVDFTFAEAPAINLDASKILLLVEGRCKTEIQVRAFPSFDEITFRYEVSPGAYFTSAVHADSDALAAVVEPPVLSSPWEDQCIRVRELVETLPQNRLNRLLSRKLIDEAEAFATKENLSLEPVHMCRAGLLMESMREGSEEILQAFLDVIDKIEDVSEACTFCVDAACDVADRDKIVRLLLHAEKRGAAGRYESENREQIAYNFTTYLMVYGPDADFGDDSPWKQYQIQTSWFNEWIGLVDRKMVAEARVVWQRHFHSISLSLLDGENPAMKNHALDVFSSALGGASGSLPSTWRVAMDHLEMDVVPTILSDSGSGSLEIMEWYTRLLTNVARELESTMREEFPDNALYAVASVERLMERMKNRAMTGAQAAVFAGVAALCAPVAENMINVAKQLREIKRLKEVYECPLPYAEFVSLSTMDICHKILEHSFRNPSKVRDRIDRIARPYMIEHFLHADETLLTHIQKVTGVIRRQQGSDPLEQHCMQVAESIASPAYHGRAILAVAETAIIPWNKRLEAAVDAALDSNQIDTALKTKLREEVNKADLALVLQKYGLTRDYIHTITASKMSFVSFVRFLLRNTNVSDPADRFGYAAKALEIYAKITGAVDTMACLTGIGKAEHAMLLIETDQLEELHRFVVEHSIVDEVIEALELREQNTTIAYDKNMEIWKERRVRNINAACSLIQRYRREDEKMDQLGRQLKRALNIMKTYELWTNHVNLNDESYRKAVLIDFISRKSRKYEQTMSLAEMLGMDEDEMGCVLIQHFIPMRKGSDENDCDVDSAVVVAKRAMQRVATASPRLLGNVMEVCCRVLIRLSDPDDTMNSLMRAEQDIHDLSTLLTAVLRNSDSKGTVTQAALEMIPFVHFALRCIQQMQGASEAKPSMSSSSENSSLEGVQGEDGRIGFSGAFRRRVGVYDSRTDGLIFNPTEAFQCICAVAPCFLPDVKYGEDPRLPKLDALTLDTAWEELFGFLNGCGQSLLELRARVLSACCGGPPQEAAHASFVQSFVQKLMGSHPSDLLLAANLVGTLSIEMGTKLMVSLVSSWSEKQKSPQTALNVMRLAQFYIGSVMTDKKTAISRLGQVQVLFSRALWRKKLAKKNVVACMEAEKAVAEFAAKALGHETVREYLESLGRDKLPSSWLENRDSRDPDLIATSQLVVGMRNFVVQLIYNAAKAASDAEREELLLTASHALQSELASHDARIPLSSIRSSYFDTLYHTLNYCLCPYSYEVIHFVLESLSSLSDTPEHKKDVAVLKEIAMALIGTARVGKITKEERVWYTERERAKDTGETANLSNEYVDSMYREEGRRLLSIPPIGSHRLPFHLFLEQKEGPIGMWVVPIIWHEITLYTLPRWHELLKKVPWYAECSPQSEKMKLKRGRLLTKAVMKMVALITDKDEKLPEADAKAIREKLQGEKGSSTIPLLHCFSAEIKDYPLGETKVQLMQMGHSVTEQWLQENPKDPSWKDVNQQKIRIHENLCKLRTKLLLIQHRVLDEDTSAYLTDDDLSSLVEYLYEKKVNWNSAEDMDRMCGLIKELSEVNGHTLQITHSALVERWLTGSEGHREEAAADIDMNDTMGGGGGGIFAQSSSDSDNDSEFLPIPIFDQDVNRIVHILRLNQQPDDRILTDILNLANMESAPGGTPTRIRAICVLLRAFDQEKLSRLGASIDILASKLDYILNKRMLTMSIGADKYDSYSRAQAQMNADDWNPSMPHPINIFVKALLSGAQRHRPHLAYLAASLTIDNFENSVGVEAKYIDAMLTKLHAERKMELLTAMLRLCRDSPKLRATKGLATYWGRTLDWAFRDSDDSTDAAYIHDWLMFAISCPSHAGRVLESTQQLLTKRGAIGAAAMVEMAASLTQKGSLLDKSRQRLEVDYPCEWATSMENSTQ